MHLSAPYLVLIVIAVAVVVFCLVGGALARTREKKLADSRPSENVETFVASFRSQVQPIARAMYVEFQQYALSGHVRLRKSDNAVKTLSLNKEDLEDVLQRVANQFGCRKPTSEDNDKFRGRETFEDYVEFIGHLNAHHEK